MSQSWRVIITNKIYFKSSVFKWILFRIFFRSHEFFWQVGKTLFWLALVTFSEVSYNGLAIMGNFYVLEKSKNSSLRQNIVEILGYHMNFTTLIWNIIRRTNNFHVTPRAFEILPQNLLNLHSVIFWDMIFRQARGCTWIFFFILWEYSISTNSI